MNHSIFALKAVETSTYIPTSKSVHHGLAAESEELDDYDDENEAFDIDIGYYDIDNYQDIHEDCSGFENQ